MSSPSCLKNPWVTANSTNDEFQKPRCATATFKVSAAAPFVTAIAIKLKRMAMLLCMAWIVGWVEGKRNPSSETVVPIVAIGNHDRLDVVPFLFFNTRIVSRHGGDQLMNMAIVWCAAVPVVRMPKRAGPVEDCARKGPSTLCSIQATVTIGKQAMRFWSGIFCLALWLVFGAPVGAVHD